MFWWAMVFFAIFLIGVTKSGFGSGVGLMIVPITAEAMDHLYHDGSRLALGLLLPLLVFGDLVAIWQYRRLFSMQIVRHLLPGTLVGLVIGGSLLFWFHHQPSEIAAPLIKIEIGLESIILVSLHWWRQWRGVQKNLMREPLRSHLTGAFSATSSTLAHAAGPVVAMYLLPLNLDRQLYVGTCAIYFFILNTAKLPVYQLSGSFKGSSLSFTLKFLPLVAAGAIFGLWVNRRMNDKIFIKLVYFITFCLGWYILIDSVHVLMKTEGWA
jgi:uncharacterized membrane protein YfcA